MKEFQFSNSKTPNNPATKWHMGTGIRNDIDIKFASNNDFSFSKSSTESSSFMTEWPQLAIAVFFRLNFDSQRKDLNFDSSCLPFSTQMEYRRTWNIKFEIFPSSYRPCQSSFLIWRAQCDSWSDYLAVIELSQVVIRSFQNIGQNRIDFSEGDLQENFFLAVTRSQNDYMQLHQRIRNWK